MSASNHSWGVLKSRLYPGQIIIVLSLDLALSISLTSDGQRIQREEKSARVLKSKLHSFNVNQSNSLTYDYDYISQDDLTCVHNILPCTTWSTTRYVKSPIADHLMRYTHILFRGTMQLKNWIAVRSHLWFVEFNRFGHYLNERSIFHKIFFFHFSTIAFCPNSRHTMSTWLCTVSYFVLLPLDMVLLRPRSLLPPLSSSVLSEREGEVYLSTRTTCHIPSKGNRVIRATFNLSTRYYKSSDSRMPAHWFLSRNDHVSWRHHGSLGFLIFSVRGLQPVVDIIVEKCRNRFSNICLRGRVLLNRGFGVHSDIR